MSYEADYVRTHQYDKTADELAEILDLSVKRIYLLKATSLYRSPKLKLQGLDYEITALENYKLGKSSLLVDIIQSRIDFLTINKQFIQEQS